MVQRCPRTGVVVSQRVQECTHNPEVPLFAMLLQQQTQTQNAAARTQLNRNASCTKQHHTRKNTPPTSPNKSRTEEAARGTRHGPCVHPNVHAHMSAKGQRVRTTAVASALATVGLLLLLLRRRMLVPQRQRHRSLPIGATSMVQWMVLERGRPARNIGSPLALPPAKQYTQCTGHARSWGREGGKRRVKRRLAE